MRLVTIRNVFSRKMRLLTTSIAIAFGVAFIAGALILGSTINKTVDDLFSNSFKNTDAVVRGPAVFSTGNDQSVRTPIDASLLETVKAVPGVADADLSYNANAQLVGPDGKVISVGGAPTFGDLWNVDPKLNAFQLVDGTAPTADNQVVVDKGSSKKAKLKVGDTVTILTNHPPEKFVIAGVAKFGQVDSPAGASYALFNKMTAARLLAQPGKVDSISVRGNGKDSQAALTNRIAAALPQDHTTEVVTGKAIEAESQKQLKSDLKFFSLLMEIFGGITLFVGAFIINNTFSILLSQRLRETALLRAIGASRRQVLRSMIIEAFVLGLIASVLGFVLGVGIAVGIKAAMNAFNIEIANGPVSIPLIAPIVSVIAGVVITFVSAVLPARRSSKVAPLAALRDVAIDNTSRSIKRFGVGVLVTIAGAGLIAWGLETHWDKAYIPTGVGAAVVLMGFAIMGPAIARPASWFIGWPLPKLMGQTGNLARENALRNPRRTSSTAAALMVGVAVVGLFSVMLTSIRVSADKSVDKAFNGDYFISTGNNDNGVSPDMGEQLKTKKELSEVAVERDFPVALDGKEAFFQAIDFNVYPKVINIPVVTGSFGHIGADQFAVEKKIAADKGWKIGQQVTVQFKQGPPQKLTLAATFVGNVPFLKYVMPLSTYEATGIPQYDSQLFANKAPGVSSDAARNAVKSVTDQYPGVKVQDLTQFKKQIDDAINNVLLFIYALLALAVLIALIGIANTMALSVLERTREIGLMRAVGMTRRQVKRMVRWESVIVALLGTFLGLIIGIVFGWALVASLHSQGITTLSIPINTMVIIVICAIIAGIFAAVFPARRAARLNVIRAIASE